MEIWVLGALGRTGRAVTAELERRDVPVVLVGRTRDRLAATGSKYVVADGADAIAAEIRRQRPAVVINTIGEYAATAPAIARAGLPGGHYLDLAADLVAIPRLLDLHEEAQAGGSTFLTGVGFGVLATEAVVVKLCEGRPTPATVRVDALASVAVEEGAVGVSLAASIVDALVSAEPGAAPRTIALPDGESVTAAGASSGELLAARRASGTPDVTVYSGLAPVSPLVRALVPLLGRLVAIPVVRRFAVRRLAAVRTKPAPRPRTHSWGHAVVTWPDGTTREGWLCAGEAMDFTAAVVAETAVRLARGEGKPGAYTPGAAFGAGLAEAAGGTFLL
ncbi:saccharopine dehydrogenase NADP-binding domain-containing protein [Amycolatopsis sp. NPDC004625]|uniref:saccharopine dehydrogenase NADP-binding domain-containing protein n=1 Tax=Amycolatopsis sp. NPDC004625 TaxID=3154670 RepID=UPI0033A2437B